MKIINYNETPRRPATTEDAPRHSSDSDVIGFADKPYPNDDPAQAATQPDPNLIDVPPPPLSLIQLEPRNNDTNNNNNNNNNPTTTPAVAGTVDQQRQQLRGRRKSMDGFLCTMAFFFPWASAMALSWVPYSRVPAREAPYEVYVNYFISHSSCSIANKYFFRRRVNVVLNTIEVTSLILFFGSACCFPNVDFWKSDTTTPPGAPKKKSAYDIFFSIWAPFMVLTPLITGIWVWDQSKHYGCSDNPSGAKCRVGKPLMIVIGVYQTFFV